MFNSFVVQIEDDVCLSPTSCCSLSDELLLDIFLVSAVYWDIVDSKADVNHDNQCDDETCGIHEFKLQIFSACGYMIIMLLIILILILISI